MQTVKTKQYRIWRKCKNGQIKTIFITVPPLHENKWARNQCVETTDDSIPQIPCNFLVNFGGCRNCPKQITYGPPRQFCITIEKDVDVDEHMRKVIEKMKTVPWEYR